jgi:hypothetical protein
MPDPAFGIQLVYNKTDYPEIGVVNVQRGFDQGSSGLEAGRKK